MKKIFILLFLSLPYLLIGQTTTNEKVFKRPKIGLVLSGGGAKGLAHIGVLKILEEQGIRPDYITGTSMGSIVGALYALGYNAAELDSIVSAINWKGIFNDNLPRSKLSMEEKEDDGRFMLEIPIKKFTISLPRGLIAGQKLTLLLTKLMLPASNIKDFNNLPIPFRCIATDLVNGQAVVLKSGYLAQATRASMAIPTVVTPVEVNGHLLVDGGIVRNFPVQDVIDMGADFVIGVDVGAPLRSRNEINSLLDVMDQVMSFRGDKSTAEQRKKCDILITPNIHGVSAASFEQADEIIQRGEEAAEEKLGEIEAFADSLKKMNVRFKNIPTPRIPPFYMIKKIDIIGIKEVSKHLVLNKLLIKEGDKVTVDEIEKAMDRIYGTRFFETVSYRILSTPDGDILQILVVEKHPDVLKVGLHYDTDIRSAVLINLTLRNWGLKGSKAVLEGSLGENPVIHASYYYYTNWRPNVGLGLDVKFSNYKVNGYEFDIGNINEVQLKNINTRLTAQTILLSSMSAGLGLQFDYSSMFAETYISFPEILGTPLPVRIKYAENFSLFNSYAYIRYDSYDRTIYPRSGLQADVYLAYIPTINNSNRVFNLFLTEDNTKPTKIEQKVNYKPFWRLSFKFNPIFKVSKRFSIGIRTGLGLAFRDTIPPSYSFFLGGIVRATPSFIPFYGLPFLSTPTGNYILGGLRFQYRLFNRIYFQANGNAAKISQSFKKAFDFNDIIYGYGATIGIDSPIGPLEFSMINGNHLISWISYINVGFRF